MDICIPFGNLVLVLTESEFQVAKDRGQQIIGTDTSSSETSSNDLVLDAKGISDATGVPKSWFLAQANQNKIPHIRLGKYVRFNKNEILKELSVKNDKRIL